MKFVIKLFPEITIKSQSVRLRFIKILAGNIRNTFQHYNINFVIVPHWDYIEILVQDEKKIEVTRNTLTRIPGIHHILEVEDIPFTTLHDIFEKVLASYQDKIIEKSFCVRIKRKGKHTFTSVEVERYIGEGLNRHVQSAHVDLVHPDVTINLEIKNNHFLLVKKRSNGIGGFPIGTQGEALSLISGGFDSGVSSYMLIRRGCRVHYCFFNLGGSMHEIGVRQIAYYLWNNFSCSHFVRFITINFEPVIKEILKKIDNSQMTVVLKRMMVRAASKIAERYSIQALITGESLGQVSSQTLTNLRLIDDISDRLIMRPLISYDKEYIINIARKIGINNLVTTIPEYCGIVSKKPIIRAVKIKIEAEEKNFNFSILEKAIKEAIHMNIRNIIQTTKEETVKVEVVTYLNSEDVILDIRSIDEQYNKPLKITGIKVISIPFYKLATKFSELDQHKTYLLWCEHGMLSRLQALYLHEQGFINVKVYNPS